MRTYWRSLGELENSPSSQAYREREFPEGASELPEGVTRREMITLLGASLSLAGLTAACRRPVESIVPYVTPPEQIIPGVPRYYATTMPFGRSAYGLVVESHEARPTKIEGNSLHPTTLGATSLHAQASILGLYDPDRSQHPTLRAEAKSWADFLAAWAEIEKGHFASGGTGIAILTESFASPTLARLAALVSARFPRARWAAYEAASDETVLAGVRAATGRDLQPSLQLDKAKVILALDADPLANHPEGVRHTRGFAQGRRPRTEAMTAEANGAGMSRLWSVEGIYSLTGAMADHRLRLASSRIGAFVAALASRLSAAGVPSRYGAAAAAELPGVDHRWLDALAKDLAANRGRGLIVAGERQPAQVHAAVLALNSALGNVGETILYHDLTSAAVSRIESLKTLAADLRSGAIKTLVVLGGNPVYDAPADLDFAKAMAAAETSIAFTASVNETAHAATWHIPRAHYLESWGDAVAVGGTLSVVQPLILPLYGAKSDVEMMGLLATGKDTPGYDLVRETWKPLLGEAAFEKAWGHLLHDGIMTGSGSPAIVPEIVGQPIAGLGAQAAESAGSPAGQSFAGSAGGAGALEAVFVPAYSVHDGRFANDAWLQELPDAITKVTWDNPALIGPKTAKTLGVEDGDLVRVTVEGRTVSIATLIVPGMADGTVALTLGYGRTHAGRVGDGVGFDVYPLRTSTGSGFVRAARVERAGSRYPISQTQEHGSMEGRDIVREFDFGAHPKGVAEGSGEASHDAHEGDAKGHEPGLFSLWKEHTYDTGHQWGMTIDLNSCIGCNACMVACQSENNVPVVGKKQVANGREMHWLRVDRYFSNREGADPEDPEMVFQPVPCMQCENAPCEQVCPVGATVHDHEGLNVMVYNRCIGTRYCSNNCPYKVRRFNFFNYTKDTPEILKLAQNPDVTVRARGVMEKCTYCIQRVNAGKINARLAGHELADGEIKTACQQACPASAIEFGDTRDPNSRVAKLKADPRNYSLLEELNVKPRTTYLSRIRNPHPDLAGAVRSEGHA